MAIKDILLPLATYPKPMGTTALEKCVAIGKYIGARISAIEMIVLTPATPYAETFILNDLSTGEAAESQKLLHLAEERLQAFENSALSSQVAHEKKLVSCATEDATSVLIESARLKDLTLVAIRAYDDPQEKFIEALIFESGRPMLIFSEELADSLPNSFDHVAIAWDHSRHAARAVADALPLLQNAKIIRVFAVTDNRTAAELESGAALTRHLAEHGIKATFETIKSGGNSVGTVMEAYVKTNNVDLLVMGAYGRSRLKEFIWGGATYTILGHPPCWVMMSH